MLEHQKARCLDVVFWHLLQSVPNRLVADANLQFNRDKHPQSLRDDVAFLLQLLYYANVRDVFTWTAERRYRT